jgi:cation diffusion facilitator family transporter
VTLLSVATAAALVVVKAVVWAMSHSVALLASLADSGLDLLASTVTFFAVRYAATPPDAEHRFGHGKAEAFASLIQAGLVFAAGALIGQEGVRHLLHPEPVSNTPWAIGVMLISVVLVSALIWAQSRSLRANASVAVAADRMHYVADLLSNLVALAGIGLVVVFGWTGFDALGGLAVAAILLWGAVSVFREAAGQLMDAEIPETDRTRIADLMSEHPSIRGVHQLRTRVSGPVLHVQMHVDMDPDITLEQAHQVLVAAEKRVLSEFPNADILSHPDPRGRAERHGGAFSEFHEDEHDDEAEAV